MLKCGLIVASVLLILSIITISIFPQIMNFIIAKKMTILEGTKGMEIWSKKDNPLEINYRLFHVKNWKAISLGKAETLELEEKGPYKFLIYRNRSVVKFSNDKNLLFYQESDHFYPHPEQDKNKLNEYITLINVPALAIDNIIKKKVPLFSKYFTSYTYKHISDAFVTHRVREFLFDSYNIKLIPFIQKFPKMDALTKFSFNKRTFYKGNLTMNTGKFSIKEKMNIEEWNGHSFINLWRNIGDCNEVKGTDGTAFHPGISKDEILTVFNVNMGRSLKFQYSKDIYVKDILTYKYHPINSTFSACSYENANGEFTNSNNSCYCESEEDVNFYKNGVQPLSSLYNGAPIYVSYPHFYLSDKSFLDNISGLSPSAKNHSLFISIEPQTGLVIYGIKRVQINAYLSKELTKYKVFSKMKSRMFPLFWIEEIGIIKDEDAIKMKNEIFKKQDLFKCIILFLISTFSIMILFFKFYV